MATVNPATRANYEPNSWGGAREDPAAGFTTYPDGQATGPRRRTRPESFADHYSQARQFFISQTEVEQQHIIDAFIGYTADATPLLQACGVDSRLDDGFIAIDQTTPAQFITNCAKLRFWERLVLYSLDPAA
jgi:catalase